MDNDMNPAKKLFVKNTPAPRSGRAGKKTVSAAFIALSAFVFFILLPAPAQACTGVSISRDGKVFVASNWDWVNLKLKFWFTPPEQGKFGLFSTGLGIGYPIGGVSDQGIMGAGAGVPTQKINKPPSWKKLSKRQGLKRKHKYSQLLANLRQVAQFAREADFDGIETNHAVYADKSGASFIIEADGKGGALLIYKDKQVRFSLDAASGQWVKHGPEPLPKHIKPGADFQVVTNFLHSAPRKGGIIGSFPCWRYEKAVKTLENMGTPTFEKMSRLMDGIHLEGKAPTKLTTIADLTTGDVVIYYLHDFENGIRFNIHEELKKGWHAWDARELFKLRYHPLFIFCVLVFLSALFVWPGVFLLRKTGVLKGAPYVPETPALKRTGRLARLVAAAGSLIFLAIVYEYPYILSHQLKVVKYRLEVNFFYHYGTPFYIGLFLSTLVLVFAALSWKNKYWSLAGRIHYTLLALVFLLVLRIML